MVKRLSHYLLACFVCYCELILGAHVHGHCSDALLDGAREYQCCKEILECMAKFTNDGRSNHNIK